MDNLKHTISNKSAVKEMKSNSKKMEKENLLMEQKLSNLKERLKGEMDARRSSGGPRWQSSQNNQPSKRPQYTSVKVLRDEPIESYMARPPDQKKKETRQQKGKTTKKSSSSSSSSSASTNHNNFIIGKKGTKSCSSSSNIPGMSPQPPSKPKQQSNTFAYSNASMFENERIKSNTQSSLNDNTRYGNHEQSPTPTSNPLLEGTYDERANAQSFQEALNEWRKGGITTTSAASVNNSNPLLDGVYNEKESAQSFQNALNEWRSGGTASTSMADNTRQEKPKVHRSETSVSVQSRQSTYDLSDIENKIKFDSSLSYLEKLLLKKHRKDSIFNYSLPRPKSAAATTKEIVYKINDKENYKTELETSRSAGGSPKRPTTSERNWRNRYDGMGGYFEIGINANPDEEYYVDEPEIRNTDSPDVISENIKDATDLNYYGESDGYWRPASSYGSSR